MEIKLNTANKFEERHIGPNPEEVKQMLAGIGCDSLEQLIRETVPEDIALNRSLNLPGGVSEAAFLQEMKGLASKNKVFKSYIGLGYYDCITPSVILRNIFENPGWYTSYTPYQSEISQGRLEALLNFQTMVADLTGMEISGASLLDEGTAAAEAMTMLYRSRENNEADSFFVSDKCLPQTIDVLLTRAEPLGIKIVIDDCHEFEFNNSFFGALVQYPTKDGRIIDYTSFVKRAHENGVLVAFAADLLSLTLLAPPGELEADVVIGTSQRFGVPVGFGGPHAAFFATREKYKRQMPGRIIGVTIDSHGNKAYRMALQVREQHIRRDKATSNICTTQSLLAIMASMYAVYHGPQGLREIAEKIHYLAVLLEEGLNKLGYNQLNDYYFDTLKVSVGDTASEEEIRKLALKSEINLRYTDTGYICISLDETTGVEDINAILHIFAEAAGKKYEAVESDRTLKFKIPDYLVRKSEFLTHPVFNTHHSETEMLRYIKSLENKDISLANSMIPLGSCTMKLNAASEMIPLSWEAFSKPHPFAPADQVTGYLEIFSEFEKTLCEITGFDAVSLQPNSGAQGEFAGLMVIREYFKNIDQAHRNIVLIPSSAHGTNPASAVMAGFDVVVVKCDENGNVDLPDLRLKVEKHSKELAALMVTYPSTHGVFEEAIREICFLIHENGGQVYMDGANMNAQVGLTSPAAIGADVCHLNLHKTFSIPHGGGGPGMGPICVAAHLASYLPGHAVVKSGGEKGIHAVSSAPWGSASIILISYGYIRMLGKNGVTNATKHAILNANYIKARLKDYYSFLFSGKNGKVAHEMIIDLRKFKASAKIEPEDIAKRLIDYGYHAPTMSFPVVGTFMIEPTESESKDELDKFCEAMISIYGELQEIAEGKADTENNVLKNAPHTAAEVTADEWKHPYSRSKAAYPLPYLKNNKYWVPVGRVNNVYGDRHLVCTCPPVEDYV